MANVFVFIAFLFASPAFAGHSEGNGGDMCENRFKIVREDLASWLYRGGGKTLRLPFSVTAEVYASSMLANIDEASVSCIDQEIVVGGNPKTCANYIDATGTKKIVCNSVRFQATTESDQYVLVHHEYAGLSGFEVTIGGESDYSVSNQITGSLENQVVKKLVVRSAAPSVCRENEIVGTFAGTFEHTDASGKPPFAVKIVIYPATESATPTNPCPQHRVEYSRPDLNPGIGTIIGSAAIDLTTSQLTISNTHRSNRGVPGHDYLFIRTIDLSSFGFNAEMMWWDRTGALRMQKCARISNSGKCLEPLY